MSGLIISPLTQLPRASCQRKTRLIVAERANQATHALATILAVVGTRLLLNDAVLTGNAALIAGCAIFGGAMSLTYLASTLSHSFLRGRWKHRFRTIDQVVIFLLISGSYTPVGLTICREHGMWLLLVAMWTMSLAGIATKLFVTGLRNVPVWFYAVTGWMPALAVGPMVSWFPPGAIVWIIVGGFCYTVGTFFLANDERAVWYHPIWHLLVMTGTACHFMVMYQYLVPSLS